MCAVLIVYSNHNYKNRDNFKGGNYRDYEPLLPYLTSPSGGPFM